MKPPLIIFIYIFFSVFSLSVLSAQQSEVIFCIQPAAGNIHDEDLFVKNTLKNEILSHNIIITDNQNEADYTFIYSLTPEFFHRNTLEIFDLFIMLIDNSTNETIYRQHIYYSTLNKDLLGSSVQLPVMEMIAAITPASEEYVPDQDTEKTDEHDIVHVPDQDTEKADEHDIVHVPDQDSDKTAEPVQKLYELTEFVNSNVSELYDWRNKKWYFSGTVAWAPRAYIGEYLSAFFPNACIGVAAEFHFKDRFSVEAGLAVTTDWVALDPAGDADFRDLILEIPVSFRYVFKPSTHFMLEPYAGLIFNIAFYGTIKPPPVSWMAGFQYGVKAGPGIIIIDPRFSMDITKTRLNEIYGYKAEFDRIKIYMSAGYKFSFNK